MCIESGAKVMNRITSWKKIAKEVEIPAVGEERNDRQSARPSPYECAIAARTLRYARVLFFGVVVVIVVVVAVGSTDGALSFLEVLR